jgi:peptidoglycan/xylan/chitin deacetylase (PgdA/CDA1 family)
MNGSKGVWKMSLELLALMSKGSMTSYHYLLLSKLNKIQLEIPDNKNKAVTLSFDVETWSNFCGGLVDKSADPDGEYFTYIPKLLNTLNDYAIKSQFFVCGKILEDYPDVFRQAVREGHSLGGHGYKHELMPHYSYNEQEKIIHKVRCIMEKIGHELKSWRCPGLAANINTYRALKKEKITFCSNARVGGPMKIEGVVEVPLTDKMDEKILGFNKKESGSPAVWVNYMKKKVEECTRGVIVFGMHTWLQRRVDPDCDALEKFLRYLDSRRDEYWIGGFEGYERWS